MPRDVCGSRLPVGSSHTSSGGRFTMARAIETRCCSPPESWSGALIELVLQANETQDLGNLRLDDVAAFSRLPRARMQRFRKNGLVRQEFEVLENAADIAAQIGHAPVTHRAQILARDEDMAVGGLQLARDQFDKRGFARSGMTYQKDEFSRMICREMSCREGLLGCAGYTLVTWSNVITELLMGCCCTSSTESVGSEGTGRAKRPFYQEPSNGFRCAPARSRAYSREAWRLVA